MSLFERLRRLSFYYRCLLFGVCVWLVLFLSALVANFLGRDIPAWIWASLGMLFVGSAVAGTWSLLIDVWKAFLKTYSAEIPEPERTANVAGTGCMSVFAIGMTIIGIIFIVFLMKVMLHG